MLSVQVYRYNPEVDTVPRMPRNVDLFIAANGDYLYCYNDVSHHHPIGNVAKGLTTSTP
jgi:hypothetical protein